MSDLTDIDPAPQQTGIDSSLTDYAGDYVTDMLGRGEALTDLPYEAYTGPLTAGESDPGRRAEHRARQLG